MHMCYVTFARAQIVMSALIASWSMALLGHELDLIRFDDITQNSLV